MARNYLQGKFTPKNPQKYVGDVNSIIFRSSWEYKFFIRCDNDPNILKWNSEEIVIPYWSPIDERNRRYFVDAIIQVKTKTGEVKNFLVEIKPSSQMVPPKPKKNQKALTEETKTYITNQAKWNAATEWAKKNGMEFKVINEKDLGIK